MAYPTIDDALSDRPAVERALAIARTLAASDPEARADVRAFAARLTTPAAAPPEREP